MAATNLHGPVGRRESGVVRTVPTIVDIYNRPVGGNSMGQTITPLGGPSIPLSAVQPSAPDLALSLTRLKALKDQGVLTDEEFQRAKQKLLSDQK